MNLYVYDHVTDGSDFDFTLVKVKYSDKYSNSENSLETAYFHFKNTDCMFKRFMDCFNLQFIEYAKLKKDQERVE